MQGFSARFVRMPTEMANQSYCAGLTTKRLSSQKAHLIAEELWAKANREFLHVNILQLGCQEVATLMDGDNSSQDCQS